MPKYTVDVKAFISVTVDAPDEKSARDTANCFVETLSPHDQYVRGYNEEQAMQGVAARVVNAGDFDIDGQSEVEEADQDA